MLGLRRSLAFDVSQSPNVLSLLTILSKPKLGRTTMATHIVMDHTGDTRHYFNPDDVRALEEAEKRFRELTALGFTAAIRTAPGEVCKVHSFDPTAEETLFFPRLVGG